ncbi:4-hydroxy-3-methylbut-2-enyl diphosphate reductase [Oleisolibacter albus]|uniref:4-hydroxy-3-methylbut-2-enyl diphosphate reductase n=1 Tax=Oleisolibacter albus TaxID=2171757 RepID=UPI000DF299BC|nr:4-hydroxy-3-methylbut-2-enyl diphosphate reductase [Oleisolibacter albus]
MNIPSAPRRPLTVLLAAPRGSCAGVERAIAIVEEALRRYGPPVYVRHEIVHNRYVVDRLKRQGAVFVDELDAVPDGRPVVFSAHGVAETVRQEAGRRRLPVVDATCPLVAKVHRAVDRHVRAGRPVVLIGHDGHAEVVGTLGQAPPGAVHLVESPADVDRLTLPADRTIAYATQTTLAVEETAAVVTRLQQRFPLLTGPARDDICYATSNRQAAVKAIAPRVDLLLVVGAPNSSNSNRLVEVARTTGAGDARLIERAHDLPWDRLETIASLGLTAGASAPELLVQEVLDALRLRFTLDVRTVRLAEETQSFRLPRFPPLFAAPDQAAE